MGTEFAPTYAIVTLGYLEEVMCSRIGEDFSLEVSQKFKGVFFTYLDDVFLTWKTELIDGSLATYLYTLSNETTIVGGALAETIEETKAKAPAFVRTANRACTKDDYVYWIGESGIGGLVDSAVHGEEEIGMRKGKRMGPCDTP